MKTTYVFNLDSKLISEGYLSEIAREFSISYKSAHYALMSGRIIQNCYFSRDKNFIATKMIFKTSIKTSDLRMRNTKHLLNMDKIIELRKNKNLSREKLAVLLNVSLTVIYDMENNPTHNPTISPIMRMAKFYDVKIEELVNMNVLKIAQLPTIE